MKIRTGFVSNSSSASFVLEIGMPIDKFLKTIFNYFEYGVFYKDEFIKIIEKSIINTKEYVQKEKDEIAKKGKVDSLNTLWFTQAKGRLKELQDILIKLPIMDNDEVVKTILKYNRLDIKQNVFGHTEIYGWTSMWNDIDDAGELMKTLIVFVDTQLPLIKHIFRVTDD